MKKLSIILFSVFSLSLALFALPTLVHAQTVTIVPAISDVQVAPPPGFGIDPNTSLSTIISSLIGIIFFVGALLAMYFLVFGAFDWILSGGDKEKINSARGKILNAIIGLAVLALAFVLLTVISKVVNIDIQHLTLPQLGPKTGTISSSASPTSAPSAYSAATTADACHALNPSGKWTDTASIKCAP